MLAQNETLAGLENRQGRKSLEGSNPSPSSKSNTYVQQHCVSSAAQLAQTAHKSPQSPHKKFTQREHADLVEQMRATRLRLGLSYQQLSAVSGYTAPTIWWLERRSSKPRLQTIQDLTQAMNQILTLKENGHAV